MTPEEQLAEIFKHLEDLQNSVIDMHGNLSGIHDSYGEMKSHTSEQMEVHPDLDVSMNNIKDMLEQKMKHTETMIQNAFDPVRIDHITNFMDIMNKAMTDQIIEEPDLSHIDFDSIHIPGEE